MPDVPMPRLSDSMEEGTILRWLKSDGDEVARGEDIVEIETDKANMTYQADADGPLQIVASEGDTLPIGETIARIGGGSASASAAAGTGQAAETAGESGGSKDAGAGGGTATKTQAPAPGGEPPGDESAAGNGARQRPAAAAAAGGEGKRVKASPVARRMARELGIDLAALKGSGPGGRIVKADVEGAEPGAKAAPAAPAPASSAAGPAGAGEPGTAKGETTVQELDRTQQVIARRMAESKATVPEFTLQTEIAMDHAVDLRAQLKQAAGEAAVPSYNDMVVKACARALREHPRANGSYRDGRFELHERVNVGVAVAADDALIVPTVFDADRKSLGQIATETRALAQRVRAGEVTPPELSGGTFTVSNLGMYGITNFTAIINPPQAAILAVGELRRVPVVDERGEVVAGQRMQVTLACDHRILYGAPAAEFLARVRMLLEQPAALAL